MPTSSGIGDAAAEQVEQAVEVLEVEDHLRHRERCAGVQLLPEALELEVHVVCGRVHGHADEEGRRRVDRLAVEVLARVQPRDELGQADRVHLVDAARAGVVADLGRIAGDREHVADTGRVRAEQDRLEPHDRRVARGHVRDGLDRARLLDRGRDDDRAHARARPRVVVDVDDVHEAGLAKLP